MVPCSSVFFFTKIQGFKKCARFKLKFVRPFFFATGIEVIEFFWEPELVLVYFISSMLELLEEACSLLAQPKTAKIGVLFVGVLSTKMCIMWVDVATTTILLLDTGQ